MPKYEDLINQIFLKKKDMWNLGAEYKYEYIDDKIKISKDGKYVLAADYKLLGLYNIYNSVWYWGYSVFLVNKRKAVEKEKLAVFYDNFLKDMKNFDDIAYLEHVNYFTNNDNFYISLNKIDMVVKIGMQAFDGDWFLIMCNTSNNTTCIPNKGPGIKRLEYIIINNITLL